MSLTVRSIRVLRDHLLANNDGNAAGHAYAAAQDHDYGVIHRVTQCMGQMLYEPGLEADARPARALPLNPFPTPFVAVLLITSLLQSCALPLHAPPDTTHYVIIGFGVVSVHENPKNAIVATNAQDVGVCITDRPGVKLAAGYLSSTVVSVADGAKDVRVEVTRRPFGPFRVETTKATLEPSSKGVGR